MYATVRHYEGITDADEVARRVKEGFIPLISDLEGFIGYSFIDAGDGVMVSTSIFEEQTHEEESNEVAATWVKHNIADLVPNPPAITKGHVVARK
jgi:hypothetical protein